VADLQPVILSEMPLNYLKSGNLKILYMLKSFTIKQLDVFRTQLAKTIKKAETKKEKAAEIAKMTRLVGAFVALGMAKDRINDFIFNRDFDLTDTFVDNLWKVMGLSKYQAWQFREEGAWELAQKIVAPPFKILEGVTRDYDKWAKEDLSLKTSQTITSIPQAGKMYYWWFGAGAVKNKKRRIKKIWEDLTEMRAVTRKYEKIKKEDFQKGVDFMKENKTALLAVKQGSDWKRKWNNFQKMIDKTDDKVKKADLKKKQDALYAKFERYIEGLD